MGNVDNGNITNVFLTLGNFCECFWWYWDFRHYYGYFGPWFSIMVVDDTEI